MIREVVLRCFCSASGFYVYMLQQEHRGRIQHNDIQGKFILLRWEGSERGQRLTAPNRNRWHADAHTVHSCKSTRMRCARQVACRRSLHTIGKYPYQRSRLDPSPRRVLDRAGRGLGRSTPAAGSWRCPARLGTAPEPVVRGRVPGTLAVYTNDRGSPRFVAAHPDILPWGLRLVAAVPRPGSCFVAAGTVGRTLERPRPQASWNQCPRFWRCRCCSS